VLCKKLREQATEATDSARRDRHIRAASAAVSQHSLPVCQPSFQSARRRRDIEMCSPTRTLKDNEN